MVSDSLDLRIASTRDLEDFARLWISGVPALPANEGYSVTLQWRGGVGPTTKSLQRLRARRGTLYLSDTATAISTVIEFRCCIWHRRASAVFTLPIGSFGQLDGTQFIFEGVTAGERRVGLDNHKSGQMLCETSVFMDLRTVKDMYERASIQNLGRDFPRDDGSPPPPPSTVRMDKLLPLDSPASKADDRIVSLVGDHAAGLRLLFSHHV